MFGYLAFYRGKRFEVYTDQGKYAAQTLAAAHFKARKQHEVDVYLCERPDGTTVLQSTCF